MAELGEAVISAYKKVITAYVVMVVKRWPMGRNGLGQFTPFQLNGMLQLLPGEYSTIMNFSLIKTGWSAVECRFRLTLPIALTVTVVEGYITYRGPTILNEYGGLELGHCFMVLVICSKLVKKWKL